MSKNCSNFAAQSFWKDMKKLIIVWMALCGAMALQAEPVLIGDLYYELANGQATVTYAHKLSADNYAGLTRVDVPLQVEYDNKSYGVTAIGDHAFAGNTTIRLIALTQNIISVGQYAFYNCKALEEIYLTAAKITSIGEYTFGNCEVMTYCELPKSVTAIGDYAFYGCKALVNVTIPEGVASLGERAFRFCTGLENVSLPASLVTIGELAFYGCTSLKSITNHRTTPQNISTGNVFDGCNDDLKNILLYVPQGSRNAYEVANEWKKFTIAEMEEGLEKGERREAKGESGKMIRDGRLVIEKNGEKYDVQGRRMENGKLKMENGK